MGEYENLKDRLAKQEVVILDGAIGTQLQSMGVPMSNEAWAATALESHPYTVRRMHENYIRAGVDIITINTYASARHNLDPLGLADRTAELNMRAVMLAEDARDKAAKERPVLIAGSVSNFGLMAGSEPGWHRIPLFGGRQETSEAQAKANLREQAEILAEAGVDFLLAESTGGHTHRKWVMEACLSTGLPVWAGFRCRLDQGDAQPKVGYRSDEAFADTLGEIISLGGDAVSIFHSTVESTDAGLPILQEQWTGPVGVYPEADRPDYVARYRDGRIETRISVDDFVAWAKSCVERRVQIVGGCCGIELDYIKPLREALPSHLPAA